MRFPRTIGTVIACLLRVGTPLRWDVTSGAPSRNDAALFKSKSAPAGG